MCRKARGGCHIGARHGTGQRTHDSTQASKHSTRTRLPSHTSHTPPLPAGSRSPMRFFSIQVERNCWLSLLFPSLYFIPNRTCRHRGHGPFPKRTNRHPTDPIYSQPASLYSTTGMTKRFSSTLLPNQSTATSSACLERGVH